MLRILLRLAVFKNYRMEISKFKYVHFSLLYNRDNRFAYKFFPDDKFVVCKGILIELLSPVYQFGYLKILM